MAENTNGGMYANTQTWNFFKGCYFDCNYCEPTFKRQAKRQKNNCMSCYAYKPHVHPERIPKIPNKPIIFAAGNADICFNSDDSLMFDAIDAIKNHKSTMEKIFYFQSRVPSYFEKFISAFPSNVILITTIETNRDEGYQFVSKCPKPSKRYEEFRKLDYPRKVVTIEPMIDFDVDVFAGWIININPEYVWIGFNSKPKSVYLNEPSEYKVREFIAILLEHGIKIKGKDLRGMSLPEGVEYE
jgi:hypothetical protein